MREWMAGALGVVIAFLVVAGTDAVMLQIYPLPPGTVVTQKTLPAIVKSRPVIVKAVVGVANLIGACLGAWLAAMLARRARRTVATAVTTVFAVLSSINTVIVGQAWAGVVLLLVLPLAGRAVGHAMSRRYPDGPVNSIPSPQTVQ